MNKLEELIGGFLRGNTTDLLGAPVDIVNSVLSAVGVKTVENPVMGSDWWRETFKQKPVSQDTLTETAASFISPGALVKGATLGAVGMIASASRVKTAKEVNQAAEMKRLGETDRKIFEETGIFENPIDKTPVAEIKDKAEYFDYSKVAIDEDLLYLSGKDLTVGDVYKNTDLYKAVPGLEKTPINFDPAKKNEAAYHLGYRSITMGYFDTLIGLETTVLHEMQHGVQVLQDLTIGASPYKYMNTKLQTKATKNFSKISLQVDELASRFKLDPELTTDVLRYLSGRDSAIAAIKNPIATVRLHAELFLKSKTPGIKAASTGIATLDTARADRAAAVTKYKNVGGEAQSSMVEFSYENNLPLTDYPIDRYAQIGLDISKLTPP